jgi:hypothetical protein
MKELIKKLQKALKDPQYREGWVSSITMSQIDCERKYRIDNKKVGKHLNAKDRIAIAEMGANHFIDLLCATTKKNNT